MIGSLILAIVLEKLVPTPKDMRLSRTRTQASIPSLLLISNGDPFLESSRNPLANFFSSTSHYLITY